MPASSIPVGASRIEFVSKSYSTPCFTYKPPTWRDGPMLLVFHGYLGNAAEYRNFAISLAERCRALVVAPLFDPKRFSEEAYHFGGVMRKGKAQPRAAWTFGRVQDIVTCIRKRVGRATMPYALVGHSAGGQFLVRLAAFQPNDAQRIVAANPGGLLFPNRTALYPHGFGGLPPQLSSETALRKYLAAPLTIYLGTADNDPDHATLDRSPPSLAQGATRLERGRACFEAGRRLAQARGWALNWRKVEAPDVGHDGAFMFAAPEALEALCGMEGGDFS